MTDRVVVVTGAAGPAGQATTRALLASGARVVGVDANADALAALAAGVGDGFHGEVVDLLDPAATSDWAARTVASYGHVDGVAHLVGGWRGGKTFADNSFADSDLLFALLVRTLQTTSLAFHDALVASEQARFVIVSATAVDDPPPGGASYAAAKAAAETWTRSLAASFAAVQGDDLRAAAVALVAKALLTDAMREAKPEAKFAGYTHVDELATVITGLWDEEARALNGSRVRLAP